MGIGHSNIEPLVRVPGVSSAYTRTHMNIFLDVACTTDGDWKKNIPGYESSQRTVAREDERLYFFVCFLLPHVCDSLSVKGAGLVLRHDPLLFPREGPVVRDHFAYERCPPGGFLPGWDDVRQVWAFFFFESDARIADGPYAPTNKQGKKKKQC